MSDDDDYLSDKFLVNATEELTAPKTYSQIRKDALKKSHDKNIQNRTKSRRQREVESREEGLSKNLFEKAQEDQRAGNGSDNKALSMMMKMGFTPGQSLGRQLSPPVRRDSQEDGLLNLQDRNELPPSPVQHKTEPLPLNEWLGKKGIGAVKRARSPSASERIAKMAKMEEDADHRSFRDRAREEYEERKAEAKLADIAQNTGPAQRTCSNLDEKVGKTLNVLWLNPSKPEMFPGGLMDALALHHEQYIQANIATETVQARLRRQMQADALSTRTERDEDDEVGEGSLRMAVTDTSTTQKDKKKLVDSNQEYDADFLEEAAQFLRLQPQDRLSLVLSYLRETYAYCFYCGTEYESLEEMVTQCPGPEEDDHD